jgi:hypothetical protein
MRAAGELRRRKRVDALRRAVERMPVSSRKAMLEGLGSGTIIAGAYTVGPAICPALAAYRRGARTGYTDFARAWDRYARGRGVRKAGADDTATLIAMIRESLPADEDATQGVPAMNGNARRPRATGANGNGQVPGANGNRNGHRAPATNGARPAPEGARPPIERTAR